MVQTTDCLLCGFALKIKAICRYIKQNYPQIPIVLDAKRGDKTALNNMRVKRLSAMTLMQ